MARATKKNKALKNGFFSFSRLLHVYLSTFLLSLLILFSFTGFTLNHRWYDSLDNQETRTEMTISPEQSRDWNLLGDQKDSLVTDVISNSSQLNKNWNPDLTKITTDLRRKFSLPVPSSVEIEAEFQEVLLDFKVPAGYATITLSFSDSSLVFEQEKGSVIGILNDLHKGRHSGEAWAWVIDISAVLIIVFSITGFIILFQGKKHRRGGTSSFLFGTLTPYIFYWWFVPFFGG